MAAPPEHTSGRAPHGAPTQLPAPRWPSSFRDDTKQWLNELHAFRRRLERFLVDPDDRHLRSLVAELTSLRNQPGHATRAFACSQAVDLGDAIALHCMQLLEQAYPLPRHLDQLVRLPLFDQHIRLRLADRVVAYGSAPLLAELATQLSMYHLAGLDDDALPARVRFALQLLGMWLSEAAFARAVQRFAQLSELAQHTALALAYDWEQPDTTFLEVAELLDTHAPCHSDPA